MEQVTEVTEVTEATEANVRTATKVKATKKSKKAVEERTETSASEMSKAQVERLKYFTRSYDGITLLIGETRNRFKCINKELNVEEDPFIKSLELTKKQLISKILKEMDVWPIWNKWLVNVSGIGAAIASHLILLYYYRFVPICQACGSEIEKQEVEGKKTYYCPTCRKSIKGEGNLHFGVQVKDFPTISKWYKYMGMHCVDGVKPKRKKGVQIDYSPKGRTLCYHIAEQITKKRNKLYRKFYETRKSYREQTHPGDKQKAHRDNMARNETSKLFLSHFWEVARTIDKLPVTEPYVQKYMGHTDITKPFYWGDGEKWLN